MRWGHIPEEARRFRFQKTTRPATESWNTDSVSDLKELTLRFREFSKDRDWEQFHDPKSLILALVGEVGELAELFQWQPHERQDLQQPDPELVRRASEELSDILLYVLRLADVMNIEIGGAANSKLTAAEERFPAQEFTGRAPDKVRGS